MRGSDLLIVLGVIAIIVGIIARFGLLSWFGNLPGDIRYEGDRTTVFIPITSMLLVSLGLSVLLNLIIRMFQD